MKERLDIYPSADLRRAIDVWRATRRNPMPSRADAAKELIELGLKVDDAPSVPLPRRVKPVLRRRTADP